MHSVHALHKGEPGAEICGRLGAFAGLQDRLVCSHFPVSESTMAQRAGAKASDTDKRGIDR